MECYKRCLSVWGGIAVLGAGILAVLVGILFGFGLLPLITPVVYALIAVALVGAALFSAAAVLAGRNPRLLRCLSRTAGQWIAGFIGTLASALAVLSFIAVAPAWLGGVLIGLLTLFTALLFIGWARHAVCAGDAQSVGTME
ncbi:MAG: hypothetical protein IKB87_04345 [Clostridia bacterium]|nr:hypothetical protein [Clostridia bacterium]